MTDILATSDISQADPVPAKRGIQLGQIVREGAPEALEKVLATARKAAWVLAQPELVRVLPTGWKVLHKPGLYAPEVLDLLRQRGVQFTEDSPAMAGYFPDGGLFILETPLGHMVPYLALEAKHQGAGGNAIERWHKNYTLTKLLGHDMAMITFATGEGAAPQGPIPKTLNVAMFEYAVSRSKPQRVWNQLYLQGPSMFSAIHGFEVTALTELLRQAIVEGAALFART